MGQVTVLPASSQIARHKDVVWHLPANTESEITTLAAVCQVKRQQHIPLGTRNEGEIHYKDSSGDEQVGSHDLSSTNVAARLTTDGTKSIKMKFLDRLAELLCYKKHAHYVACTSLQEGKDEVTILAARNASWRDSDIKLLEDLANMLELTAARDTLNVESFPDLRENFSKYYTPRLQHHAKELLTLIKKTEEMGDLVAFLKAFLSGNISSQRLVNMVDEISYSTTFYSKINRLFTAKQVKQQIRELGFIRRPEIAYATFYEAAREISSFRSVKIKLLAGSKGKHVRPSPSLCPQLQTKEAQQKLNSELHKLKWVHAEMRMVLHLISTDCSARTFPYLGISKKTCFMCGHILHKLDLFRARKNHGKVYSQWTLPSSLVVPFGYQGRLEHAVQNLRDVLQHESALEDNQHIDAVKESTLSTPVAPQRTVWSPFSRHIRDARFQSREAEWLSLRSPTVIAARTNQINTSKLKISFSPETDDKQALETASTPIPSGSKSKFCAQCGTITEHLNPCSKCHSTSYCSVGCRTAHWLRHKYACRLGRPLDEADDFILACRTEEFPTDDIVAKAFGILYFTSAVDRKRLFGLYCQLVNRWGVGEEELREAWQQNKLKDFILFRGSQIPCAAIKKEMRWLSQQTGFATNAVSEFSKVLESGRHFLNHEDRKIAYNQWEPREKLEAYLFLCQILNGFVPDADEDNWLFLGFCTAQDDNATRQLACLYRALIDRCEFEEFWKAMVGSGMVNLFKKYGFGRVITGLRNFETLMSAVGTWYQSVWELKRFTRLPHPEPMRAVIADYGFCNCQTPQERIDLRRIYTKFFAQGGDEMALHGACIKGQLAPFLESELEELPFAAELVSNFYPLEGCGYMGMVVETALFCPESIHEKVKKLQEETGEEGVILTVLNEYNEGMCEALKERAEFLGQGLRIRTTRVHGETLKMMSGM